MDKEKIKKLLIKSIPSIVMTLFGLLNSKNILIVLPIISAHPYYLVAMEMKTNRERFFKGFLEICVLLLPYFIGINKGDSFSRDLGRVICAGEYILTSILWIGTYIINKYNSVVLKVDKEACISEKRNIIGVILINLIPLVFIGAVQYAVCFESYLKGTARDLLYTLFYITEFVSLAGGVYYSKVNKGLLGSGKKAVYTSLAMILCCLIMQYSLSFFSLPEEGFYIWLPIKYICQLVTGAIIWSGDKKS